MCPLIPRPGTHEEREEGSKTEAQALRGMLKSKPRGEVEHVQNPSIIPPPSTSFIKRYLL